MIRFRKYRPLTKPGKYTIDYNIKDLIEIYTKRWLLKWVKENHPEIVKQAKKEITELAKASNK